MTERKTGFLRNYLASRTANMRSARNREMIRSEISRNLVFRWPTRAQLQALWTGPQEAEGRALFARRYGSVSAQDLEARGEETRRVFTVWAVAAVVLFLGAVAMAISADDHMTLLSALAMGFVSVFAAVMAVVQAWVMRQIEERRVLGMREVLNGRPRS